MAARSFADFLATAVRILAAECPSAYHQVCTSLAPRCISIIVDNAPLMLRSSRTELTIEPAQDDAEAELRTSRAVLRALLSGEVLIYDAIRGDALFLRGRSADLVALYDGLILFLRGAARCPSLLALLEEYLPPQIPL